MATDKTFAQSLWSWCCSLKLTIVLASLATLLTMGGSLVMHFNPRVFSGMDMQVLNDWWQLRGADNLRLSWWLPAAGISSVLLALNTLCCLIDWLGKVKTRWRKSGEYCIHCGFILIVTAFCWGGFGGWRLPEQVLQVGQTLPLPELPGHYLRLDHFQPVIGDSGRPLDMLSDLSLLRGDLVLKQEQVKTNTPLIYGGLVVVPVSFGQRADGFRFATANGIIDLRQGAQLALADNGLDLQVLNFWPDAARSGAGQVVYRGDQLNNPAFEFVLSRAGQPLWRGWYLLREGLPQELRRRGVILRPTDPLGRYYSVLTANYDPGAYLALVGSVFIGVGVWLALFSFYYKRARGDRPDVA
ncbi:MAG: cytochrome c biogenesis protein ResB [Desulfuromonadales bacterium]|nr:cytochrome c biogenesis protein ResB [Desulfuromonadales bacterium]